MDRILQVILGLCSAALALIFVACGGAGTSSRHLTSGDDGVVVSNGQPAVFAAVDDASFDRLTTLCNAKDELGVTRMIDAGKVLVVPVGTKVRVIRARVLSTEVRIQDGDHAGKEAIISFEFLKPKTDSPTQTPAPISSPKDPKVKPVTLWVTVLGGEDVVSKRFYLLDDDSVPKTFTELKAAIIDRNAKEKGKIIIAVVGTKKNALPVGYLAVTQVAKWAEEEAGLSLVYPAAKE